MAQARASQRKPTRIVTLRITEGEADLIMALVSMVHGHRSRSPRKYAERIRKALEAALGYGHADMNPCHLALRTVTLYDYDDHPQIGDHDRPMAHLTSDGFQR